MKDKETETDSLQNPQAFASAFEKTPLRNRKRLAQELFDRLSTAYRPSTVASKITDFRAALRAKKLSDVLLTTTPKGGVVPVSLYETIKASYRKKLWEEHTNIRELDADLFLSIAENLLDEENLTKNPYRLAVGIAAVTGRRTIEILKQGSFSPVDVQTQNQLLFAGQAKTRGEPGTRPPYIIPTLIPTKTILRAFEVLRTRLPLGNLTNDQINQRHEGNLNACLARNFPVDRFGPLSIHSLRAAYAAICFEIYGKPNRISQAAYYSRILGHNASEREGGDLVTALSYFDFQIKNNWMPHKKNKNIPQPTPSRRRSIC